MPIVSRLIPWQVALAATLICGATQAQMDGMSGGGGAPANAAAGSLYHTSFVFLKGGLLHWSTCTWQDGCSGMGTIGPFERACAIAGDSRRMVVADANASSGLATLYVYEEIESATPAVNLIQTIVTNIPASAVATCHLAIGGDYAYLATSDTNGMAQVNLKTAKINVGFGCYGVVLTMTANDNTVVLNTRDCFEAFDANGEPLVHGGETHQEFVPQLAGYRPPLSK
jgi:hypothetical protein